LTFAHPRHSCVVLLGARSAQAEPVLRLAALALATAVALEDGTAPAPAPAAGALFAELRRMVAVDVRSPAVQDWAGARP